MFRITYDPVMMNSFVKTVYCTDEELRHPKSTIFDLIGLDTSINQLFPFISGKEKDFMFYLKFGIVDGKWNFYHQNYYWSILLDASIIEKIMANEMGTLEDKSCSYIGLIINGVPNFFICFSEKKNHSINQQAQSEKYDDKKTLMNQFFDTCINFHEKIIYEKIYTKKEVLFYHDIIIPTENGLVHINPLSSKDFIFTNMLIAKSDNQASEMICELLSERYYHHLKPTIENFCNNMVKIQSTKSKESYNEIYNLFKKHDKEYFDEKMTSLQKKALNIFTDCQKYNNSNQADNMAKFIVEFIISLKRDFSYELSTVYHRLLHYPNERIKLYQAYPDHPYIKLLKMVHRHFVNKYGKQSNKFISSTDITDFLEKNYMDLVIYDEKTMLFVDAMSRRSDIFVYMYNLYLNTISSDIKPKYKTKYNFFAFKVFSPFLFIMEHMLCNK